MRTDLENELTRTLRAANVAAPQPTRDFSDRLAARRRSRRRTRMVGLAATVAAAATVAGAAVTVGLPLGSAGDPPAVADRPLPGGSLPGGSMPALDRARARPVGTVWPEAVVTLPATLPDRRPLYPVHAVGANRYLGMPIDSQGGFALPVEVNARTGEARELMTPGRPEGVTDYGFGGLETTDKHITWVAVVSTMDGRRFREVWAVPKAGGQPRRIAQVDDGTAFVSVAEADGTFYLNVYSETVDAIYRVAADGKLEKLAGSEKYRLRSGTWAEKVDGELPGTASPGAASPSADDAYRVPTFWNVATGERRTPTTLAGVTPLRCSVEVCVGSAGKSLVSYRADGTGPARLTGVSFSEFSDVFTYGDRFVQIRTRVGGGQDAAFLWDRATNTLAKLDGVDPIEGDLIQLRKAGDRQYVLDLTRIR